MDFGNIGSYAVEVVADSTGKWIGNGLRFCTRAEAMAYGNFVNFSWSMVEKVRVVYSEDAPNSKFTDDKVERLELPSIIDRIKATLDEVVPA